jgi:hypothetical protein
MKYVILTWLIFLIGCASSKQSGSEISVVRAEWKNWSGGIPGVGGIDYNITLFAMKPESYEFDLFIVDGKNLDIRNQKISGDTITLRIREDRSNKPKKLETRPASPKKRAEDPAEAILVYKFNQKEGRLTINSWLKGEDIFMR